METAVVTGCTGYIGTHLVPALQQAGFHVIPMQRDFYPVQCDRIYHLACPSSSDAINNHTTDVMDIIFDKTREAMRICPTATFINGSSIGCIECDDPSEQGGYNSAKLAMEHYLKHSGMKYVNYRIPSVYNEAIRNDGLIKRSVNGTATPPTNPDRMHYIGHMDGVIDALVHLTPMPVEYVTLGKIYEQFNSGRRGLHR